jgi:hypothetical protein
MVVVVMPERSRATVFGADTAAALHGALRDELGYEGDPVQLAYRTQVLVAQRR